MFFLFSGIRSLHAQNDGSNCGQEVKLPTPGEICNNIPFEMKEKEMWFEVTPSEPEFLLKLRKQNENEMVEQLKVSMYEGDCPDLKLLKEGHPGGKGQFAFLKFKELNSGNNYKLKLENENMERKNFEMCLMRPVVAPCPDKVFICNTETNICKTYDPNSPTEIVEGKPGGECRTSDYYIADLCPYKQITFEAKMTDQHLAYLNNNNADVVYWNSGTSYSNSITTPFPPTPFTTYYINSQHNDEYVWISINEKDVYQGMRDQLYLSINIITPPSVTIFPSEYTLCQGQSATFTAQVTNNDEEIPGSTIYKWTASDGSTGKGFNSTTITVSPLATTTYTFTVTNQSGCSSTASATVNVVNVSKFSFDAYDNVEGEPVTFSLVPPVIPNTNYTLDFMDGTTVGPTSSASPVTHTFNYPGYYRVKLTSVNLTCSTSFTYFQDIYIIPSVSNYSPSRTCLQNFSYTYGTEDVIISAPNVIWNSGGTITIKKKLIIKAGAKLTISNGTKVQFGPQGLIIIEAAVFSPAFKASGKLFLNGATLSGIEFSNCNGNTVKMMWQGIEVWGNKDKSPSPSYQGYVSIINSTIEDAYTGALSGRSKLMLVPGKTDQYLPNGHNVAFGGGIIEASGSTFNRCNVSIRFYEYPKASNRNSITNCTFICKTSGVDGGLLDPYFVITGNDNYLNTFISKHNPYMGWLGDIKNIGRSNAHIEALGIKTINVKDNSFSNATYFITSENAKFNITKLTKNEGNFFNDCYYAILINNFTSSFYGQNIISNTFKDCYWGINIGSSSGDNIKGNKFNDLASPGSQTMNNVGIFIYNVSNYKIVDNIFTRYDNALSCTNSGTTSSLIGYETNGNIFNECYRPIETQSSNDKLSILCNQFFNVNNNEYLNKTWKISGTLPNQGRAATNPTDIKAPTGNTFNIGTTQIHKAIDAQITSAPYYFNYYPHTNDFTVPDKFDANSDINVQTGSIPFTTMADACATKKKCTGDGCKETLNEYKNRVAQLQQEYTDLEKILDKGRTTELLNLINSKNTPVNKLREELIKSSPLSDTVVKMLLERAVPLPPQVFQDVIIPNSPINERYTRNMDKKINTFPLAVKENIRRAQSYNPPYRTLTQIMRETNQTENERELLLNDVIRDFMDNDSVSFALELLEKENAKEYRQGLIGTYITTGDFAMASSKLAIYETPTQGDMDFKELYQLYTNLGMQDKSLWDMDSMQAEKVRGIASHCPATLAVSNAQTVLKHVLGESVTPCPQSPSNQRLFFNNDHSFISEYSEDNGSEEMDNRFNNYPNPVTDFTIIPYILPEGARGILKVYGIRGELVKEIELPEGNSNYILSLKDFVPGLYIYGITNNSGKVIKFQKLTVNK